ncbi:MAG: methionyl-tRNA formyltransferase [Bacteroidota bacterium]|nr:methionyl-tRNA formyltransferase [Bacteroidota bacterium]MDP3144363.1 methionyl-tRNA formyltransferase [Bacteroidota bacterium]MDP3557177.1 methionyl-tRNA formyltransferase [Bacteroidota bacterium]
MRIVFMGTPEFAVASLAILIKNNYNVVGVVTAPDKPAGRGQQIQQSAIKKFAVEHNLKLLQPEKLKDEHFISELKNLKADLQFVVAFRMLPEVVWDMPKMGTFNLHASLLPKYRGAAPINWAIIKGETESGVTTFKLKHQIDTGNILFQEKVHIEETTTAGELHDKLMQVGAELILKTVKEIQISFESGKELKFLPQNESLACHAPKIFKEDCLIDWEKPAIEIYNLIRGLSPYPAAYTQLKNGDEEIQLVKIYHSKYELGSPNHPNGSLYTDNKTFLKVYCEDGLIDVKELQLQGKKKISIQEFLRGFKIKENAKFVS